MMKKLIATALAAAMIFGLVSVALAAGFSDIEDHARKNDILKLVSLGIIDGYPDGTFKPENPVTRAEFAKLIVTTMGLGDAAKLMAGVATPFADVPANHWASGYINLAHSEDIIDGYPDGTFKPAGNVTYAEALKMVLCALGYTEDLIKPIYWPVTWIAKSVNVGLTKGVDVSPNLAAPRGEIAALLENSLTIGKVVQTGYGDKVEYIVKEGETFLKGLAGAEPVTGTLVSSPELFAVKDDLIKVQVGTDESGDPIEKIFDLLNSDDAIGLLGHKVKVWANSLGEVLFVEDLSTVKSGTFDGTNVKVGTTKITDHKHVFRNYAKDGTLAETDDVTVVYDGTKPLSVVACGYTTGIVKSVSTLYRTITFESGSLKLAKDADVNWYGDASALDEIEKDDVVQYIANTGNTRVAIVVTSDAHVGTYTKLVGKTTATIGGTVFEAANENVLKDIKLGSELKVLLNKDGKIVKCKVIDAAVSGNIALVLDRVDKLRTIDGEKSYLKVLRADGTKATIEIDWSVSDDVYAKRGFVIEYTLDEDGIISDAPEKLEDASSSTKYNVVSKYNLIGSYVVTADTVVFSYNSTEMTGKVLSAEDVLAKLTVTGKVVADGQFAKVVVMTDSEAVASDDEYGVVVGSYQAYSGGSAKYFVSILSNGVVTDYECIQAHAGTPKNTVVSFTVSAGKATLKVETPKNGQKITVSEGVYGEWRVASLDDNFVTIKLYDDKGQVVAKDIGGNDVVPMVFVVNDDTQYVDGTGKTATQLGVLSVNDKVEIYSTDITVKDSEDNDVVVGLLSKVIKVVE